MQRAVDLFQTRDPHRLDRRSRPGGRLC